MDYNGGAAVASGLIAGAVMGGGLYAGMAIAPRQMRMDLFHVLGTLLVPQAGSPVAYMVGATAHAVMSLAIALVYAVFFLPFAEGSNLVGWGGPLRLRSLDHHGRQPGGYGLHPSPHARQRASDTWGLRPGLSKGDRRQLLPAPPALRAACGGPVHRLQLSSGGRELRGWGCDLTPTLTHHGRGVVLKKIWNGYPH